MVNDVNDCILINVIMAMQEPNLNFARCPTMTYSLNAVCHVLQHALKQALGSCLRSGGWGLWC